MTVSGMNSNSASTLFSSLNTGSGYNIISASAEMASIRTGSYGKLLNSYYNMNSDSQTSKVKSQGGTDNTSRGYYERYLREKEAANNKTQSSTDSSTVTEKNSNSLVASGSDAMVKAIDKLNAEDTFKTGTDGSYKTDDIYKTVKSYVDGYNNALDAAKKTTVSGVNSNVSSMTNVTNMYAKSLESIGIKIGDDKKLSLDETTFKNADMSKVKDVFGKSNYGYSVRTNAYMANYYATNAMNNQKTYGSNGGFNTSDLMSNFSTYF